ncbi:serine hydrolase [Brevibacterium aurantiacum]|uniref:Beta-lactamase family protein n=1 Tax=Brevibacterium aurantiacum TaxID=273384 RepID=A0A556CCE0_BREAU|nr:serine hydrolase domain-containing protein [Brevibacterium aurantiacum]TSI15109.1 beta-lactamase family protein [Brevibacterium aurantiacum]
MTESEVENLNRPGKDAVARLLKKDVARGVLPGAMAIHHRARDTSLLAVGVQDLSTMQPMTKETLFVWDSLSKLLTAALALTLIGDGRLRLNDEVAGWLPEVEKSRVLVSPDASLTDTIDADRAITVEDLLTLRGGLGFPANFDSPIVHELTNTLQEGPTPRTMDRASWLKAAGSLPLVHQPGEGWTYNTGSTLLGLFLERVGREPLDVLMSDRILAPLGMQDARWWVDENDAHRFASRYELLDETKGLLNEVDAPSGFYSHPPSFPDGASGLIGTAGDLLKFAMMLINNGRYEGGQLIPRHLVAAMTTDQLTSQQRQQAGPFLDSGEGWGYGGSVRQDGSYGWTGGIGTTARVNSRQGTVSILLTQVALYGPGGSPTLTQYEQLD